MATSREVSTAARDWLLDEYPDFRENILQMTPGDIAAKANVEYPGGWCSFVVDNDLDR